MNRTNTRTYRFFNRSMRGLLKGCDVIASGVIAGVEAAGDFGVDAWHGIRDAAKENVSQVPPPRQPITIDGTASVVE